MKNRFLLLLLACCFTGLLVSSCINDKGNYEYEDANKIMPVTISGVNDTTIMINTVLRIVPEVENANDGNYSYRWFVTPSVTAGSLPQRTILSDESTLNVPIQLETGKYLLSFEVRDIERDVYVRQQVYLTVTASEINLGWYVLKDIDNETDFDYISTDGSIQRADVLLNKAIPSGRLKGTAVQMAFQPDRYFQQIKNADGTVTTLANQRAFHILSSEDIRTYEAGQMWLYKNYADQFYGLPENCKPQSIRYAVNAYDLFMVNDGKMYSIFGMMANIGKYSAPKIGFYSLHKDMIVPGYSTALLFDLESSSFCYTDAYGATLNPIDDENPAAVNPVGVSPNDMPYTLTDLLMRADQVMSATAYAVMKDKSKEEYYLAGINFQAYMNPSAYPFLSFKAIPEGCKMPLAKVKAGAYSGNFIYFGDGNKLCVYWDAEGLDVREPVLKTYPANETISYIAHMYSGYSPAYNYLVVLTNSASGWKMYVYNVKGLGNPEIDDEPAFVYSGTGNARYVMYRTK